MDLLRYLWPSLQQAFPLFPFLKHPRTELVTPDWQLASLAEAGAGLARWRQGPGREGAMGWRVLAYWGSHSRYEEALVGLKCLQLSQH